MILDRALLPSGRTEPVGQCAYIGSRQDCIDCGISESVLTFISRRKEFFVPAARRAVAKRTPCRGPCLFEPVRPREAIPSIVAVLEAVRRFKSQCSAACRSPTRAPNRRLGAQLFRCSVSRRQSWRCRSVCGVGTLPTATPDRHFYGAQRHSRNMIWQMAPRGCALASGWLFMMLILLMDASRAAAVRGEAG